MEVVSTGIGSWPGTDIAGALKTSFAECPDLPYLPELPERGPYAGLVGRSTAVLTGLAVDLVPAGWRLTDASSREHRQARATLRADLDHLEEVAQGYAGPVKIGCAGPWTLAAAMERPRGDRVLADSGARRDLGQSLADGLAELVTELRRRLPEVSWLVQLDEPLLPAVLGGQVATASGWGHHRSVPVPEVSEMITRVVAGLDPAAVLIHSCAAAFPIALVHQAGVAGLLVDLDQLSPADWDVLGAGLEQGLRLGAGALPTGSELTADQVAHRVLGPVRDLEVDPAAISLVLTPACGLAQLTPAAAVQSLRTVRTAAGIVADALSE